MGPSVNILRTEYKVAWLIPKVVIHSFWQTAFPAAREIVFFSEEWPVRYPAAISFGNTLKGVQSDCGRSTHLIVVNDVLSLHIAVSHIH